MLPSRSKSTNTNSLTNLNGRTKSMRTARWARIAMVVCLTTSLIGALSAQDAAGDMAQLKAQVSQQQRQIQELSRKLEAFTKALEQMNRRNASEVPARLC